MKQFVEASLLLALTVLSTDQRSKNVLANDQACYTLGSVDKVVYRLVFRSPSIKQSFFFSPSQHSTSKKSALLSNYS
jgi:hypothetical protein